ncbi:unnamed protein product [Paramecium sonneborni]|uniref:Uncharacterized protein n=1 Tax=Paramecium sonneborni TaxID=65129 RepID=A0A8S1QRB3_9CILI|nr:unnamed protein product [Paramecium sonneborni]
MIQNIIINYFQKYGNKQIKKIELIFQIFSVHKIDQLKLITQQNKNQSKDQLIDSIITSQMQQLQNLINSTFSLIITSTPNDNLNKNKIEVQSQSHFTLNFQALQL